MRLDEGLSVVSNTIQDGAPDDVILDLADRFGTTNRFHGFAIGSIPWTGRTLELWQHFQARDG